MSAPLNVYLSKPAEDDLFQIMHDAEYPVPSGWLGDIKATLERLSQFPAMGRRRPELRLGLRSFVVGSYLIFYQFDDKELEVVRVLHGARDLDTIFHNN